jgi:hypothetical protein
MSNASKMDNVPLPKRRCGRCQCEFDGDPNLFFQTDWALCQPCGGILLPSQHAVTPVGPLPSGAGSP